jgi:general secretion pathway protein M
MTNASSTLSSRDLANVPRFLVYAALVIGLLSVAQTALFDLFEKLSAASTEERLLAQLDSVPTAHVGSGTGPKPNVSPFLEGPSITVAGAALQQRFGDAVQKAGGHVMSARIELQGPQAKEGYIALATDFEMDQRAIQPFLYDLEAGVPFLYINTLLIQPAVEERVESNMRVQILVSGRWMGNQ